MPYESLQFEADRVQFGAFELSSGLVGKMNSYQGIDLSSNPMPDIAGISAASGGYFIGEDANDPQIGDVRIRFTAVNPSTVSIVAQQAGNTFQPYVTRAGGNVLLLEPGTVGQEQMFQMALDDNARLTWILRLVGLVVMASGLGALLRPLSVFADVVPLFGRIVAAGAGIISFLVALALSALTIALAWLAFRPLIGGGLLLLTGLAMWAAIKMLKKAPAEEAPDAAAA
jgi:hypothetical protein